MDADEGLPADGDVRRPLGVGEGVGERVGGGAADGGQKSKSSSKTLLRFFFL